MINNNDGLFGKKEKEADEPKKEVDLILIEQLEKFLVKAKEGVVGDYLLTYLDKAADDGESSPLYMKIACKPEKLNMACDYAKREIMDFMLGLTYGDDDD